MRTSRGCSIASKTTSLARPGRPAVAQQVVLDYVAERKPDRTLDLRVDAQPLAEFATERGVRPPRLKSVVQRMQDANLLHTIQGGRYAVARGGTPTETPVFDSLDLLPGALLSRLSEMPYYLSWRTALLHHLLIEQQSSSVVAAVTRRKRSAAFNGYRVQFETIKQEKLFGYSELRRPTGVIVMADLEKAIIDSLDQPRLAAPVAVIAGGLRYAWRRRNLDPERLADYAVRFGSPTLNRRLGFFMDRYGIPGHEPLALHLGRGYAVSMEPGGLRQGNVNPRWRVVEDEDIQQLIDAEAARTRLGADQVLLLVARSPVVGHLARTYWRPVHPQGRRTPLPRVQRPSRFVDPLFAEWLTIATTRGARSHPAAAVDREV